MKYMGSKSRIAKYILPLILGGREDEWYVEPFCGGCGTLDKVQGKRIGADINEYLIAMWQALLAGWEPPDRISNDEYNDIRINKDDYLMYVVGFVGIGCSFGGKWFGGYARDGAGKRNYCLESKNNVLKQVPLIKDVQFRCRSYDKLELPENSIIYADPPYSGVTKYKDKFNHDEFWQWCRDKVKEGHRLYVSEYNAPEDFKSIWRKEIVSSLTKDTGAKRGIEKLFVHESQYKNRKLF